jgi:hypothetical protein
MIYSVHYRAPRQPRGAAHLHICFATTLAEARRLVHQLLNEGAFTTRIYDGQRVVWTN